MESVESGNSGAKVVEMDTSGHKSRIPHIGCTSTHVHLDHNYSPYDFFKLIIIEDFSSGILQECTDMKSEMESYERKCDRDRTKYPYFTPFSQD